MGIKERTIDLLRRIGFGSFDSRELARVLSNAEGEVWGNSRSVFKNLRTSFWEIVDSEGELFSLKDICISQGRSSTKIRFTEEAIRVFCPRLSRNYPPIISTNFWGRFRGKILNESKKGV